MSYFFSSKHKSSLKMKQVQDKIGGSPLQMAAKSEMLIKLHLDDGSDIAIDIPVKNLLKISCEEEKYSQKASFSNLRHCTITALFQPSGDEVPDYAWRDFSVLATYVNEYGDKVSCATDEELTEALEWASTVKMFDDNDGVILHLYCRVISICHLTIGEVVGNIANDVANSVNSFFSKVKKIKVKKFFQGKREPFWKTRFKKRSRLECEIYSPHQYLNKAIEFMFFPELSSKRSTPDFSQSLEDFGMAIMDGIVWGVDTVSTAILEVQQGHSSKKPVTTAVQRSSSNISISNISNSPSMVKSTGSLSSAMSSPGHFDDDKDNDDGSVSTVHEQVEIIFDCKDSEKTPAEWKIFFGNNSDEAISVSSCSADGVLIPTNKDVMSCCDEGTHESIGKDSLKADLSLASEASNSFSKVSSNSNVSLASEDSNSFSKVSSNVSLASEVSNSFSKVSLEANLVPDEESFQDVTKDDDSWAVLND